MRETATIANIVAVERVGKIAPLAAQKKSFKTADVSQKPSFAELVERARKKIAQTEEPRKEIAQMEKPRGDDNLSMQSVTEKSAQKSAAEKNADAANRTEKSAVQNERENVGDEKIRAEKTADDALEADARLQTLVAGGIIGETLQIDLAQMEIVSSESGAVAIDSIGNAQARQSAFFADADNAALVDFGTISAGEIDASAESAQVVGATQLMFADARQGAENAKELAAGNSNDAPLLADEVLPAERSAVLLAAQNAQEADAAFAGGAASDGANNNFAENENAEISVEKARTFALDQDGKIIVSDFRTTFDNEQIADAAKTKTAAEKSTVSTGEVGASQAELTMSVAQSVRQNVLSENAQSAGATSSNFQAMLANQIQQNAGEFVRAGSIVLRDGNQGTINLVLHPESLGNVKISLSLSDKVVSGQIIVASEEAYNAFNDSADSLRQAFSQSGFEAGAFTVAYSGAQNSGAQNGGGESGYIFAGGGSSYEAAMGEDIAIPHGGYMQTEHVVNVVV